MAKLTCMGTRLAAGAVLASMAFGCSSERAPILEPLDNRAGPIVSDTAPVSSLPAGVLGRSAFTAAGNVAYVSLPAGTAPTGSVATVRNRSRDVSQLAALVDGGFDPVAVAAGAGDLLDIVVTDRDDATVYTTNSGVPIRRPPRVVRTIPHRGKTDVPLNARIVIVFSEPIDPQSITPSSVQLLRGGTPVSWRLELRDDGVSIALVPDAPLAPSAQYDLLIKQSIRDLDGEALEQAVTVDFRSGTAAEEPTGLIAFRLGSSHLAVMNADGTGVRIVSDLVAAGLRVSPRSKPVWSPDGTAIAFSAGRIGASSSDGEIYVINVDGSGLKALTHQGGDNILPAWSPDGTKIAFNGGGQYYSVYVMNRDGTGVTKLTTEPEYIRGYEGQWYGSDWGPAWSPDGTRIAFSRAVQFFNSSNGDAGCSPCGEMHVMNADGSGLTRLTRQELFLWNQGAPAWSPDGSKIAFGQSGNLFVMNADGSDVIPLTNYTGPSHVLPWWGGPSWSPDGQWIAYTVIDADGRTETIDIVSAKSSRVKRVFRGGEQPAWSPLVNR